MPTRAPTDPDVRALTHPVSRPAGLPSATVPEAIRLSYVNRQTEPRSVPPVSLDRVCRPTLRFPPLAPAGGCSPASSVISRRYDFLSSVPPHFVAFAWRYLSVRSFFSLPGGRVCRRSLELVTRYLRPGLTEETTGSPKFLENPDCPFAHVPHRRRQDRGHQTVTVPRHGPWSSKGKGSCEGSFDAQ